MKLSIVEIILLILFGVSAVGNVFQALFGIKIENNQSQIMQTFNMSVNENQNLNLVNTEIILTNAYISTVVSGGVTNFKMVFPVTSTNLKISERNVWALTNQTNYTKIGIFKK